MCIIDENIALETVYVVAMMDEFGGNKVSNGRLLQIQLSTWKPEYDDEPKKTCAS